MAEFISVQVDEKNVVYLNVDLIRTVNDQPDEDGVRVDFDDHHRVYLDRTRAKLLLRRVAGQPKN